MSSNGKQTKTVYVKKPFTFSYPGTKEITDASTGKVTVHKTPGFQRDFAVGEQELPPEALDHPWIQAGADGAIESDDERKERTDLEAIDKSAAEAKAKIQVTRAEQAQKRADEAAKNANKPAPASTSTTTTTSTTSVKP